MPPTCRKLGSNAGRPRAKWGTWVQSQETSATPDPQRMWDSLDSVEWRPSRGRLGPGAERSRSSEEQNVPCPIPRSYIALGKRAVWQLGSRGARNSVDFYEGSRRGMRYLRLANCPLRIALM